MTNKEAIFIINNRLNTYYCTDDDLKALDLAIKALEERPKGKWVVYKDNYGNDKPVCSCCNKEQVGYANYCSYCGADMRGDV